MSNLDIAYQNFLYTQSQSTGDKDIDRIKGMVQAGIEMYAKAQAEAVKTFYDRIMASKDFSIGFESTAGASGNGGSATTAPQQAYNTSSSSGSSKETSKDDKQQTAADANQMAQIENIWEKLTPEQKAMAIKKFPQLAQLEGNKTSSKTTTKETNAEADKAAQEAEAKKKAEADAAAKKAAEEKAAKEKAAEEAKKKPEPTLSDDPATVKAREDAEKARAEQEAAQNKQPV